jgi:hypothetical protein
MDNENIKKFRVRKILKISLISLLTVFLLLLIFGFVRILPKDIEYTNITSNSFTVSWSTRFPTNGVVSVVEGKNRLPVSFTVLGKDLGFDTRDIRFAELLATEKANENIWESDSQSVSLSDIVTEKVIDEKGSYYTHHIEVRGVNPESEYRVMIGDGLLFLNSGLFKDEPVLKTLEVGDGIDTPVPTYGLIKNANGEDLPIEELLPVNDGVVYFNYFEELSGERSNTYSSSLNEEGAWYMDISTAVDSNGELFFEKYSQEISNIYGELYIDLGPLGKWEKRINMNEASPAETIVINMPGYVEDTNNPDMLNRVDSSNTIEKEVVKGVSAQQSGCTWIDYCTYGRFDKEQNKWVNCSGVDATLQARKCGEQKDAHQAAQEIVPHRGTCPAQNGTRTIGAYEMYGTKCMKCEWQNAQTKNYGVWNGQTTTEGCTKQAIPEEEASVDDCSNASVGAKCSTGGKEGTCQNPYLGSTSRVCILKKSEEVDLDEMVISTNNRVCQNTTGCTCVYSTRDSDNPELRVDIKKGETCFTEYSKTVSTYQIPPNNPPSTPPKKPGESCRDDSKNIAYGIYNSLVNCIAREEKQLLTDEEILGKPCYEKGTSLYATSALGNMYKCENNEFKWHSANITCDEGASCGGWFRTVNQCINSKGELLDCNGTGAGSFAWTKEMGASSRGAFFLDGEKLSPGEKCSGESCLCGSNYLSSDEPFCPEVYSCLKLAENGLGTVQDTNKNGKICDTAGRTCNNGVCNGEKVSSSYVPNRDLINKTYAQEESTSEYMIDTTTGKVLGIEPGIYTLKDGEETYVFTIKTQDVKDGKGDMIVYIDSNENGIQDDGEKTLSDFSSSVKINAVKKLYTYNLKEGFNFISLPFLVNDEIARTAAGLLTLINAEYHDSVYSIAKYDGTWKIVGQNVQQYDNNDFQLIPGEGYIVKANKDISIQIAGRPIDFESSTDNAPITFYPGWNLIGVYGSNAQPYTAKSLIQSINRYEPVDFTADNVSRWESDMQRYDGLQLTKENGMELEYGFDFPINTLQSYFVRILQGKGNWQPDIR